MHLLSQQTLRATTTSCFCRLGLMAVAGLNQGISGGLNLPLLLGSFGASATLLFGALTQFLAHSLLYLLG